MEYWWCPLCEAECGDWAAHAASRPHLEARIASPFPALDVYPEPCDGVIGPATRTEIAARSPFFTTNDLLRLSGFEPFGSVERK